MALFQITSSGFGQRQQPFCAGLETDYNGIVVRTAPILGWTLGKNFNELRAYFAKKLWKVTKCGEL